MYNKKYRLEKIEEFGRHNPLYNDIEDSVFYLAYLKVDERGWILYQRNYWDWPNRINTSNIKEVAYVDDRVVVVTQNTRFTFEVIKE